MTVRVYPNFKYYDESERGSLEYENLKPSIFWRDWVNEMLTGQ